MEFDGKGVSPLAEYYLANGQILARKMFGYHGRKEPGNEELLRTRGGLLYYLYDRLGTVVALADRQGELVTRYYYDVFGQPLAGTFGPYNSYGLTGKEYDSKTGQYYFGARWLEPELGRWMTQDKFRGVIIVPSTLQRYILVYNNPLRHIDLWGFWTSPVPVPVIRDEDTGGGYVGDPRDGGKREHEGLDLIAGDDTPISAPITGEVVSVRDHSIVIEAAVSGEKYTVELYHIDPEVIPGQTVIEGCPIGTGSDIQEEYPHLPNMSDHVHVEVHDSHGNNVTNEVFPGTTREERGTKGAWPNQRDVEGGTCNGF